MARLTKHSGRAVLTAVGGLVVAALPTIAVAEPAPSDDVFFYTPVPAQTVLVTAGQKSDVHLLLGADPAVTSIQLRAKTGSTWTTLASQLEPIPGTSVFDFHWKTNATGSVTFEATGSVDGTAGTPVSDTVILTSATAQASHFDFVRPAPTGVPLGVFQRADGRWFARSSGTTTRDEAPTVVDASPGSTTPLTPWALPDPTGAFDATARTFREPVDLSSHAGTELTSTVIRVNDSTSSEAAEAPVYFQKVTAVRATTAQVPGSSNVIITARATDKFGQPVVGVPMRLAGFASGSSQPVSYTVGVTDAVNGVVTFAGPGTTTTGYPAGFYTAYADLNNDGRRGSNEPSFESVVGTVSFAAPGKSLYHSDARIRAAGGVLNDSLQGTRAAAARRYQWIDQDGQLSYTSVAGLRGGVGRVSLPAHLTWVNAHGAPFNPRWMKRGRFETRAWSNIRRRPGLRDAATTFQQDAAYGLNVEWEVKNIRPFTTAAALNAAFANLAAAARQYYGPAWASRVEVKMLSNLPGGPAFALRVLRTAHAYGFTTIYLARGSAARTQIPASAHSYVTYVRGAAPGLYAPIPPASQAAPVTLQEPSLS